MIDYPHAKSGFTLVEVMVSVIIISVVIAALLKIYANNIHIFTTFKKQSDTNQYASLLISDKNYGFENQKLHLNDLLDDFNLDDNFRKKLKNIKIEFAYEELQSISNGDDNTSDTVLKIGKTLIKTKSSSISLLRLAGQ